MATIAERFAYFKRLIAQAIIMPVLVLLLLVGLLSWQVYQLVLASLWVDHTDRVIAQANLAFQLALRAETGLRGYLISADSRDLQPYLDAQTTIGPAFADLQDMVSDNPPQVARVHRMATDFSLWNADANQEIQSRSKGIVPVQQAYARARSLFPMDTIRYENLQFVATEDQLRAQRTAAVTRTIESAIGSAVFLAVACGIILGLISARRLVRVSQEYEQALSTAQKASEMLGTTLLSIGDAVLVTDQHGLVTTLNDVAERLTGWSAKDATGKPASQVFVIVNELSRASVESPVERVIREGVVVGLANHTVLIRRDGTEIPIDDSGAPVHDDTGVLTGVVLVFRDITERRRAEEIVRLHSSIVESSDDAIISKDLTGKITSWNKGAERIFGHSAEEMIGKPISVLAAPGVENEMPIILERIKRGEKIDHYETVRMAEDGRFIDVSLTISPIRDSTGRIVGASKVARDISERKKAEKLLAHAYEKEHRIAEALQDSLLARPSSDAFPHIETETLYRAARQEARVGGDYFDLFLLNENKVALVVGDISGKGLDAAVRTAEMKYTLRGFLREHPDPSTGMQRLNTFICESQALETEAQHFFLCLTVAVIEPLERKADLCVAGSEPPLIVRSDGVVDTVSISGMPLGVEPSAQYNGTQVTIRESDILLIATDGITEARRDKELLGFEGLTRLVEQCGPKGSLESIGTCVLSRAEEFAQGSFADDVCLLLARVK